MKQSQELLHAARQLLSGTQRAGDIPVDFAHGRSRGAALLARQALELAALRHMENTHDAINRPDFNAVFVVLNELADPEEREIIQRLAWAWSALSSACHTHAYPLEPTHAELYRWMEAIDAFIERNDPSPS